LGTNQLSFSYYLSLSSLSNLGTASGFSGISIFRATNDLQTTPAMVVSNPLASAFFPSLAAHINAGRHTEVTTLISKALRIALYITIPAMAVAFVLRAQIIRIYLGTGDASWPLTTTAINTFSMFLIGVVPAAAIVLLARVYYSLKDTRASTIISVIASVIGVISAWITVTQLNMGVAGVALAVSIASIVQAGLYLYDLERRPGIDLGLPLIIRSAILYLVTGILTAGIAWIGLQLVHYGYVQTKLDLFTTRRILGLFLQLVVAASIGTTWFILWSKWVHPKELQWLRTSLSTKK
jgi:putative peptidoglycan lipid II flippase